MIALITIQVFEVAVGANFGPVRHLLFGLNFFSIESCSLVVQVGISADGLIIDFVGSWGQVRWGPLTQLIDGKLRYRIRHFHV